MPVAPEQDDQRTLAELHQALAITTERPGPGGRLWCPPRTGEFLTRQMLCLGPALPGLAQRAVRLARVLEVLGRREGYVGALYRLPALWPAAFAELLQRGQPRLAGLAAFDGRQLMLTEAAMAPARGTADGTAAADRAEPAFALLLGGLPLVAAYLDMAHNMLGYATVAALLDPVTRPPPGACPPGAAHAAAAALRLALDRWLRERLETQHAQRQAMEIRRFLSRQDSSRTGSGAVDDDSILAFWCAMAPLPEPTVDGFKTFPSVARLMLGFRRAARLAATETSHPRYDHGNPDDGRDPFESADEALSHDSFASPLIALAAEPAARVNWLFNTRLTLLAPWLDLPQLGKRAPSSSLFAGDPPSDSLALTVMRAQVFGPWQRQLARQSGSAAEADGDPATEADESAPLATRNYRWLAESLAGLATEARQTACCASHHLIHHGRAEVVSLIERLWPEALNRALDAATGVPPCVPDPSAPDRLALATGLRVAAAGHPLPVSTLADAAERMGLSADRRAAMLARLVDRIADALDPQARRQIAQASRTVRRAGLTSESLADPDRLEGLAAGAPELATLLTWLERLSRATASPARTERFEADRETFAEVFEKLYPNASL